MWHTVGWHMQCSGEQGRREPPSLGLYPGRGGADMEKEVSSVVWESTWWRMAFRCEGQKRSLKWRNWGVICDESWLNEIPGDRKCKGHRQESSGYIPGMRKRIDVARLAKDNGTSDGVGQLTVPFHAHSRILSWSFLSIWRGHWKIFKWRSGVIIVSTVGRKVWRKTSLEMRRRIRKQEWDASDWKNDSNGDRNRYIWNTSFWRLT